MFEKYFEKSQANFGSPRKKKIKNKLLILLSGKI